MRINATDVVLRTKVDLQGITDSLDFTDEQAAEAARAQPKMFLAAAILRVQKMRKKHRREAKLKLLRSQYAKKIRRELVELGQRVTDKEVEERLSRRDDITQQSELVSKAEEEEEFSKLLLEAIRMRRDSLKVVSELVGAEVYVARRMEGTDTELSEIRKQIKKKYPGRVAKEERRDHK